MFSLSLVLFVCQTFNQDKNVSYIFYYNLASYFVVALTNIVEFLTSYKGYIYT